MCTVLASWNPPTLGEITRAGIYAWDRHKLCELPQTAKYISKEPTLSREEGHGHGTSMESVTTPSSDVVLFTDDRDNVGRQIEVRAFDLSN